MSLPNASPNPSPSPLQPAAPRPLIWRLCTHMTPQVLLAVMIGIALGHFYPDAAKQMKPLSDAFISLVRMVISPVVFLTVALGVASMGDLKRLGRVGGKTLLYFELVTTVALGIGLLVVNWLQPGADRDPEKMARGDISKYVKAASEHSGLEHA